MRLYQIYYLLCPTVSSLYNFQSKRFHPNNAWFVGDSTESEKFSPISELDDRRRHYLDVRPIKTKVKRDPEKSVDEILGNSKLTNGKGPERGSSCMVKVFTQIMCAIKRN